MRFVSPFIVAASLFAVAGCNGDNGDVIQASGTIEGTDINIGSEVGGRVREVRVEEGSHVRRGDTLVVIDDSDFVLQLRQATAAAEAADAQFRLARQGTREEDLIQAEEAFRSAEKDYRRMEELIASNTVTQKQYDDAKMRYISAQQMYSKLSRGLRPEEIQAARARRDQAAAQADLIRKKVSDCYVVAPADGSITLKGVEPGEIVGPGMNLLRLTYLEKVKLTVYLNAVDLGRIRLGQDAKVSVDAHPSVAYNGIVVYTSPDAEFTPKNVQTKEERTKLVFAVRIEIDNPEGVLKPGLPADASIHVGGSVDGQ